MITDITIALAQAAEYLKASGQTEKALAAGRHAPAFSLPNQDGVKTSLSSTLRRGPLLLIFYSGGWCPGCKLGLRALEEVRPLIEARGASLVAISPQTILENARTRRTTQVTPPILSDKGGKIAVQCGVRWRVPELLQTLHLMDVQRFLEGTYRERNAHDDHAHFGESAAPGERSAHAGCSACGVACDDGGAAKTTPRGNDR